MNGLNIVGSTKNDKILVVESELDALALHFAMPANITILAVGSCLKNPDNLSDCIAKNAKQLIICHDNDQAGKKMFKKWQRFYSHAIAYTPVIGKDVGEAIQNGLDVKQWIHERML